MRLQRENTGERELIQAGYRFALSLAHRTHDAEDLVQNACVKLYSRKGRLGGKALLFATIRNLFYDQVRRGKLIVFHSLESEETPEPFASGPYVEPGTESDLQVLLGILDPEEREVLYLNAVEGYSARDIGRMTRRPRNTVLSMIHRAKQQLRAAAAADQPSKSAQKVTR